MANMAAPTPMLATGIEARSGIHGLDTINRTAPTNTSRNGCSKGAGTGVSATNSRNGATKAIVAVRWSKGFCSVAGERNPQW